MRRTHFCLLLLAACTAATPAVLYATPYAANVFNTTGSTWQFTLNAPATNVTVLRNGGNAVNLGTLAAGPHTFDMTGFSTFSIQVKNTASTAWTSISDPSNQWDDFDLPAGLAVNTNPADLKYFGTTYVSNTGFGPTASGRTTSKGVYSLTADMKGVDLSTFTPTTNINDTSLAKLNGIADKVTIGDGSATHTGNSTSSPRRMSLDAGGNLILADWSDGSGGVKYMTRDLTTGGRVLAAGTNFDGTPVVENTTGNATSPGIGTGPNGGVFSVDSDALGPLPLHGSVVSTPYTTGTLGSNLTLYTMDEDLASNFTTSPQADSNNIWRYNVGSTASDYNHVPTLVVGSASIPKTTTNAANFLPLTGGVLSNMFYDPTFNKWYLLQGRSAGTEASVAVISANPDGSQATTPTVEWSSLQFSIDNSLDSDTTTPDVVNDIFRRVADAAISPDHKFLILHRSSADTAHAGIGTGDILVLPLDANGIPQLNVAAGAVTNVVDFSEIGGQGAHSTGNTVTFDAAGNLYVANSASTGAVNPTLTGQQVQVFSPGGNWIATTNSDGTFTMTPGAGGVPGDYNGNGVVDAADYVLWRNGGPLQNEVDTPGTVNAADYTAWRARFGNTSGSGSSLGGGAAVPEPGTLALVAFGLLFGGVCGRKRRVS